MALPHAHPHRWPRAIAFVAIASWMVGGPVWRQLLKGKSRAAAEWQMFSRFGSDICTVRYVQRNPDGVETPLDRFALLGHADSASAPTDVRRLKSAQDAVALGAELCKRLEAPADVRLYARCGTPEGWQEGPAGETNLCAGRRKGATK